MAVRVYTEQELLDLALGYFRVAFPGQDLSDRGFFGLLARVFGQTFALLQYGVEQCDFDSTPAYQQDADGNVRSRCSSAALDAWAFVFGLPSGVPGVYGRRGATLSTGGFGIPFGTAGTVVPAGTQATDPTGQILVQTVAQITLTGTPNTIPVQLVSVTKGTQANLSVGTVLTWVSPPAGLGTSVTLTQPLTKARDIESDAELVARLLRRIQQPRSGGTAADYRAWAEEATDANGAPLDIARAYVYPLRGGLNSVDVIPMLDGSGLGRQPSAAVIAAVKAYLDKLRPVTATVRVFQPTMFVPAALRIRVKATPSPAKNGTYSWDWDDGGVSTVITAHTVNSVTVAAVPMALSAAFAAGRRPRIQVIISTAGASPIPYVGRVTAIVGTTLTVDPPFAVQPTNTTDYFYAGSSIVVAVAERIRDYIDALGPSRQSGFADPDDAWDDNVLLERVIDEVMDTRDTDGTDMVVAMPGPLSDVVKIAVGAGAFLPLPYPVKDNDPTQGPEVAYLRQGGIEVIQA